MAEYEIYAFAPAAIASSRPQHHQTRMDEAKKMAIEMAAAGGDRRADLLQ